MIEPESLALIFPGERISSIKPLTGGCINNCYKVVTSVKAYFVKTNAAASFPRMFECEAFSLKQLKASQCVNVPNALNHGFQNDTSYLVLEYIESSKPTTKAFEQLGQNLATLHKQTSNRYGWEHDNYVGSVLQQNDWNADWHEFYADQRVLPLCRQLVETDLFTNETVMRCEQYLEIKKPHIPSEPPSLLHGDLWSGNFLTHAADKPYLIDPACYYGHREIDIAMTQLFGGFEQAFVNAYNATYPLEKDWQQRLSYFQLYPLLVHAVLFGGGYVSQCARIIHQGVK